MIWKCQNPNCGHVFDAPRISLVMALASLIPWHWCPRCRASSRVQQERLCYHYERAHDGECELYDELAPPGWSCSAGRPRNDNEGAPDDRNQRADS